MGSGWWAPISLFGPQQAESQEVFAVIQANPQDG